MTKFFSIFLKNQWNFNFDHFWPVLVSFIKWFKPVLTSWLKPPGQNFDQPWKEWRGRVEREAGGAGINGPVLDVDIIVYKNWYYQKMMEEHLKQELCNNRLATLVSPHYNILEVTEHTKIHHT